MVVWKYSIEGWGKIMADDKGEWWNHAQKCRRMADLVEASSWYHDQGEDDDARKASDLGRALQELRDAPDVAAADVAITAIYDLADEQGAWLDPTGLRAPKWPD